MYNFKYQVASSAEDATSKINASDEGKLLAGGMTLLPTMKQRLAMPSDLIDLSGASLTGITASEKTVSIGAMTTHDTVANSKEVSTAIPALAKLAGGIGDPAVRNRGTIGGSIANNDPAADYPAAVLGLGATVITNRRSISGDDFFKGMFETALEEDEVIIKVDFPTPQTASYVKFPNPASRYAIVGVFVAKTILGVRVAVTGAGACVFRATEMEAALTKDFSPAALNDSSISEEGLNADIHASAEYRAHLVGVMARRAVAACP